MEKKKDLQIDTLTISQLLQMQDLSIPVYQRPYKWSEKHISQLIEDVNFFKGKSAYRLGTLVVHKDANKPELNIVDGQQRTISCILLFRSICETIKIEDPHLKKEIEAISKNLVDFDFSNETSAYNIQRNYTVAKRAVAKCDEDFVRFFLNHCELIYFEIGHISEAFQFFDSQNARGKDLDPHDLLKAYHLREYAENDEKLKLESVTVWERHQSNELAKLFAEYLFKIRSWSRGDSAQVFDKNKIYLFKGVTIEKIGDFKYVDSLRILHHFTDEYNKSYHRQIDLGKKPYPFQLDAPIINGRRFFEMITYYKDIFDMSIKNIQDHLKLNENSKNIFHTITSYGGWERTGDTYVRTLFECALVFYVDKFGFNQINEAVERIFAWAYRLRLEYYAIQFVSLDNYVLENNLFADFKNNYSPQEALARPVDYNFRRQRSISELEEILKSLYYIN
ncbi:DUF262 domain-containing protein [Sphingobacterium sp. N143]|uniref:DUF262 domain-containing protein n=1 Tax=Sphingobacterium sp. N143 TaxID=2746727 RepID=UPI0025763281|nr:DUF262 domain-containing protein [Sphingobacterium sp. N143]MDM1296453.1 DUF262 domain-containing protein [Sphingobacterium sp. N143]